MLINELPTEKKLKVSDVIKTCLNKIKQDKGIDECDDNFCIYTEQYTAVLKHDTECYIDRYPDGDENGNDVYPCFVKEKNLSLVYYGEHFLNVIDVALDKKEDMRVDDILSSLNYYSENDDYLDL